MKFTCDSCGAQYMIGDEKLGKRGVKVRCKKCSYVIILRPAGYQPSDKKGHAKDEQSTGDLDRNEAHASSAVSLPAEAVAPTMPFAGSPPDTSDGDDDGAASELHSTSSELGLSKEFAALGFEDESQRAARDQRVKTLNVGLDVGRITPSFADVSSPFQTGRIGGSLSDSADDVEDDSSPTHADTKARAIDELVAVPRLHGLDDDPIEETSVDSRSPFSRAAEEKDELSADPSERADRDQPFGEESTGEATSPGDREAVLRSNSESEDGSTDAPSDGQLGRGQVPDEESFHDRGTAAASRVELEQDEEPVVTRRLNFDDPAAVDERISAMDKSELEDMESSLNRELDLEQKVEKRPRGGSRNATRGEHASLAALAADAVDEPHGALPSFTGARENGDAKIDSPLLDSEIKNAFDAMFSPSTPPSAAYQDGNLAASTVQEQAPVELFRSAYNDGSDKRPTRVFDIEAMQQVQAEQDLASSVAVPTNGNGRSSSVSVTPVADTPEWYVAINDEQVGPISMSDVRTRWELGDLGPNSLCWKQGMPDWIAIRLVKDLESLGDMDDRVRTVVARIEPNDGEDERRTEEAPSLAQAAEEEEQQPKVELPNSMAAKEEPPDEPSWRPSAASALASLAAAELGGDTTAAKGEKKSDVAVGRALPATSDALEKLLSGDSSSKSGASAFGAMEMSSSAIRPLPKRTEIASSVSLRDPVAARQRPTYLLPLAIVGGFIFVGLCILLAVKLLVPPPPPAVVVQQPPPQQAQPVQPAQQQLAQNTQAQPAQNTQAQPAQQQATQPAQNTQAQPAQQQPASETAQQAAQPQKTEAPPAHDEAKSAAAEGTGRPSKAARGTGEKRAGLTGGLPPSRGERAERGKTREAPAPEPKTTAKARESEDDGMKTSDEDDLLGPKKKTRTVEAPSSDLPKQLEDSDILGGLRKNKASISACVQKQKSADPSLEGTMTVKFVIEGNGSTKRWEVAPDKFKSSVVGKCVLDAVKSWTFPKFSGRPMPVDFPLPIRGGR